MVIGKDDPEIWIKFTQFVADLCCYGAHPFDIGGIFSWRHGEELGSVWKHRAANDGCDHDTLPLPNDFTVPILAGHRQSLVVLFAKSDWR